MLAHPLIKKWGEAWPGTSLSVNKIPPALSDSFLRELLRNWIFVKTVVGKCDRLTFCWSISHIMRVLLGPPPPRAIMRHFQSTYELIYTIRRQTIISQLRAIYSHTTKSSLIMKREIEELFKAWGLFTHPLNPRLPLAARLMGNDICGISAHCRMANGE